MTITSETKFIGISSDVSVEQKRSTQINEQSEGFTASEIVSIGVGYKTYVAYITQSGTNAPTALNVYQNTLDNSVVFTRFTDGTYKLSCEDIVTNAITGTRNFTLSFTGYTSTCPFIYIDSVANGEITFLVSRSLPSDGDPNDSSLNAYIELRIYE